MYCDCVDCMHATVYAYALRLRGCAESNRSTTLLEWRIQIWKVYLGLDLKEKLPWVNKKNLKTSLKSLLEAPGGGVGTFHVWSEPPPPLPSHGGGILDTVHETSRNLRYFTLRWHGGFGCEIFNSRISLCRKILPIMSLNVCSVKGGTWDIFKYLLKQMSHSK